ncbi:MAG: hypothetical protein M1826_004637, partial [Phylliscum demangeonii]
MFRAHFDEHTPFITVENIRVLDPMLILNTECGAIVDRQELSKEVSDSEDIVFLLKYLTDHRRPLTRAMLPHVSQDFMQAFIQFSKR